MAARYELFTATNKQFYFRLIAGNNEIILASEGYITKDGAKNGIASVRVNSPSDQNYSRKPSSDNRYYFTLQSTNGQTIGNSQMYSTIQAREVGISSVKLNGPSAPVVDLT